MKKLLAGLLFALCSAAHAQTTPAATLYAPGTGGIPVSGTASGATWGYDVLANIVVELHSGYTVDDMHMTLDGVTYHHSGSGRGGGYITVTDYITVTSANLLLLNADGTTSPVVDVNGNLVNFAPCATCTGVTAWTLDAMLPFATYQLEVTGLAYYRTSRGTSGPFSGNLGEATVYDETQNPVTYFNVSAIDDTLADTYNFATPSYNFLDAQTLCDAFDGEWEAYYMPTQLNAIDPAGTWQIDSLTATPIVTNAANNSGTCAWAVIWDDPAAAIPPTEYDIPAGLIGWTTSSTPVTPPADDGDDLPEPNGELQLASGVVALLGLARRVHARERSRLNRLFRVSL